MRMHTRLALAMAVVGTAGLGCVTPTEDAAEELTLMCGDAVVNELRVCADGPTVTGIDVSYWQATVDWARVRAAGHVFGIARVSDGLRPVDTQFNNNWRRMKEQGVIRGAYQFVRANQDPVRQANQLIAALEAAGGLEDTDLPPVLDLESSDGMSSATVVARAKQWLARVEEATGRRPIIYTAAFMSSVIGTHFGAWPLWVANYGATCPSMPSGWSDWQFWQYTDAGRTNGVSGNVDTNRFNGTREALQTFVASTVIGGSTGTVDPPPPPPPPARCAEAQPTGLNGGTLNMRPQPNTSRAPVGSLTASNRVPILERATGQQVGNTTLWLKVQKGSTVGWVSARYMRCTGAGQLDAEDLLLEDPGFEEGRSMGEGDFSAGDASEVTPACPF